MITTILAQEELPVDVTSASIEQYTKAVKAAKQQYLAVAFLSGADDRRYKRIRQMLQNDYLRDTDSYLQDLTKAYELLLNWRTDSDSKRDHNHEDGLVNSLAFLQATEVQQ